MKKLAPKKSPHRQLNGDSPTEPVPLATPDIGTSFLNFVRTRRAWVVGLRQYYDPEREGVDDLTERSVARAIRELCDAAPPDEIARFHDMERRVVQSGRIMPYNYGLGEFHEGDFWLSSFAVWGIVLERGEEVVFSLLPQHLQYYCGFFLRQWWVSELLGGWYAQGKQENIERLLFGPEKNKRSFKTRTEQRSRDWAIVLNIAHYRQVEKLTFNRALKRVHAEVNSELSSKRKPLSLSAIRNIFYRGIGKHLQKKD